MVFTNGCFDLLHLGHVHYLEEARSLGDALIVAVNTDASVAPPGERPRPPLHPGGRPGPGPGGLACVDRVVLFGEDTPLELITLLAPDILVKGGDYRLDEIVGREVVLARGGRVVALPLVPGYSTTRLIDRIRSGTDVRPARRWLKVAAVAQCGQTRRPHREMTVPSKRIFR